MKAVILFVGLLISSLGCHQDTVSPSRSYLPLEVGNYWELTAADWTTGDRSALVTMEITGRIARGPVLYYKMVTRRINKTSNAIDTTFYRMDASGYVYSIESPDDATEDNPMRLNAPEDEQWAYAPDDPTGIKVRALGVVQAQASTGILSNAKGFVFDAQSVPDDDTYIYLAPGIGFAVERNAAGDYKQLKRAIIGGRAFSY